MSSIDVRSIDEKDLRKEPCPATKQEFRVFLAEEAFDRAVARGDSDTTREIGGVLVGEVLRDEAGPYLRIETTIDALHAEEKGAELTFTHATWEHIHKEMDGKHETKRVVGWYHTHPGFGVFLSDRDQFIQKSFFNLPFQVAFVYDPKSHEHGMFTWHDNEVWRARRYWIGAREQAWDGPRTAPDKLDKPVRKSKQSEGGDGDERGSRSADPDSRDARDSRDEGGLAGSLGPLILIGVVLLLVGGFVGHWFGVGSANQVLTEVQVELTKARIEGAQTQLAQLQIGLVEVLRNTLADEALRRPIGEAVEDIDRVLAWLPAPSAPVPAAGGADPRAGSAAAPPGAGSAAAPPGAGSAAAAGAGSAAAAGAGSAAAAGAGSAAGPGPAAPGAGGAVAPVTGGAVASAAGGEPRLQELATRLRAARDRLLVIAQSRVSSFVVLTQLESLARRGSELRADLGHDVAEQRSGLGALYAELAAEAVKAKDLERARRLLATAAHLDPGNRSRYEQQLQSYDKAASLPRDTTDTTGSAGQGPTR